MKLKKYIKKYPFLFLLLISTLILVLTAYIGRNNIYSDFNTSLLKSPRLAAVFVGLQEGKYPWMMASYNLEAKEDLEIASVSNFSDRDSVEDIGRETTTVNQTGSKSTIDGLGSEENTISEEGSMKADSGGNTEPKYSDNKGVNENTIASIDLSKEKDDKSASNIVKNSDKSSNTHKGKTDGTDTLNDTDSQKGTVTAFFTDKVSDKDTDEETENTEKVTNTDQKTPDSAIDSVGSNSKEPQASEFTTVSEDYFDDALFIGDSRTVGLSEYSGWSNPTYYADVGLTIYDIFDKKIANVNGKDVTVLQALEKQKFKKIYIMLGINELGTGTTDTFTTEYKKVIDKIRELQPDAICFVEGIMKVSKEKSDSDPIFNNNNIKDKNDSIARLADNKDIFYIDVNEAITDQSGYLPSKYTFDSIHLKAAYYKIWTEFLTTHGVVTNE